MNPLLMLILIGVAVAGVYYVYPDIFSNFDTTPNVVQQLPTLQIPKIEKDVNFFEGSGGDWNRLGGGGGGSPAPAGFSQAVNAGTYGSSANGLYFENAIQTNFQSVTGILGNGVLQEGIVSGDTDGQVRFGTTSQWNFLHTNSSSTLVSMNIWFNGDLFDDTFGTNTAVISTFSNFNGEENGFLLYGRGGARIEVYENLENILAGNFAGITFDGTDDSNWHLLSLGLDYTSSNPSIFCIDAVCGTDFTNMDFAGNGGSATHTLTIGNQDTDNGNVWDTSYQVDDFTIWHGYNLTQSDIDTLYNGGAGSSAGSTGSNLQPSFQVLHVTFDSFI